MNNKVWICGMGAISAIGDNATENFESLLAGNSGVGKTTFLSTIHRDSLLVCEIKKSNEELAGMAKMKPNLPRAAYLSAIASEEALTQLKQQIEEPAFENLRVGFLSGNTIGGMDLSENFYSDFLKDPSSGHLSDVVNHECGAITELVAEKLNVKNYVATLSTACSSSANAIMQGCRLIKHNKLDMVIAGGTDALCRFTLNGFNTLMIVDSEPCKPFDAHRKGLNLGEGAGYVVLVSDAIKKQLNLKPIAAVSGYANANDAFHQTASSAEGIGNFLAMEQALQMSSLAPYQIDYINAHGTGTANNDSSEGIAIERLFADHVPLVSSTKANTGHTLGACGGIEAVYCCLSLQHNTVYPSLRLTTPMNDFSFEVNTKLIQGKEIHHVMSNSFGFGGNCSSLIFSKTT
nr:beta-ketoacyl-[acyl-carrier-protein] synthase family protein [Chitinophagaceae bacterium]